MTTVRAVAAWMGRFAPLHLAESWDNVGLLWGDPSSEVRRLMTCLTVTPDSADEAIAEGAGLIISHHPILFRPLQKITTEGAETAMLWRLARAGVAIYSPHTAFDNAEEGINAGLARRLGLIDVTGLRPSAGESECKVVVFTPATDREAVLDAAFGAGAGRIGLYRDCSFTTGGFGTFFGTEGTDPTVGQAGRRERVREWKVEFVCPSGRVAHVLKAIHAVHSYEEPALDVIPLQASRVGPGIGRVGNVPGPMPLDAFAAAVRSALGCGPVGVVGEGDRMIRRVAIGCGAGDDFLKDAARAGADVLLTGEARFHRAVEARSLGIGLVLAGHHATERPGVEDLADHLARAFPGLDVWASRRESDPIRFA